MSTFTTLEELTKTRDDLLKTFNSGKTRSYEYRMSQLRALKNFLIKEEAALVEALHLDLRRPSFEGACLEIGSIHADLDEIMKNLRTWMTPEVTPIPAVFAPAKSEIHFDPFGVCLLICPFNYPIILAVRVIDWPPQFHYCLCVFILFYIFLAGTIDWCYCWW